MSASGNSMLKTFCAAGGALMAIGTAFAQEFPAGSTTPTKEEIQSHLTDRTFSVALANGQTWRLEFKKNGYFFVNTSAGFSGSGEWTPEDGKLCSKLRGGDRNCNDARMHDGSMHLKRTDGEVIRYAPR
jgi:hypothetical protein